MYSAKKQRCPQTRPSPLTATHGLSFPPTQEGLAPEYFWRLMWLPEKGAFLLPPPDFLDVAAHEKAEREREERETTHVVTDGDAKGFAKDGVTYMPGDHLFVDPDGCEELEPVEKVVVKEEPAYLKGGKHKGASQNLRAFCVAELLSVSKVAGGVPKQLRVRRFVRPEDVGPDCAYRSGWRDVFYSTIEEEVYVDSVTGKTRVVPPGTPEDVAGADAFVCVGTFDVEERKVKMGAVPKEVKAPTAAAAAGAAGASKAKDKGKGKASASSAAAVSADHASDAADPIRLATMDIFAGCGGLSEGMRQAGAAHAKWAIEYEPDAAEAFRLNHEGAHVFNANCNVILHRALAQSGLGDDCVACDDCKVQSAAMPEAEAAAIPKPGEVEFICGGPPCQGFSGMNRFTLKGSLWSKVQNEMILAYLSYADLYRPRRVLFQNMHARSALTCNFPPPAAPSLSRQSHTAVCSDHLITVRSSTSRRYFLLENVRNFVSFNKGATFRTAVRTLIEIGYQARAALASACIACICGATLLVSLLRRMLVCCTETELAVTSRGESKSHGSEARLWACARRSLPRLFVAGPLRRAERRLLRLRPEPQARLPLRRGAGRGHA